MRVGRTRAELLAAPYLVGLVLLLALPALGALLLSVTDFSGVAPAGFLGFANYGRLLTEPAFWQSAGNTLIFALLSVPLRVVAALGLALVLYRRTRGITSARTAAYLPTVVPDVAYALLWLWILNPLYGPLPLAIESLGLPSPSWLTEPWGARVAIAVMGAFQVGEGFVIALAARRTIPDSLYEAAAIDRARPWFTLTRLTLPVMTPVIALLALRDLVLALQTSFVPALILTDGGPRYATTFLPVYVYREAFSYFRLGYASAISLTMFVFTALIVWFQYRLAKRWRIV